MIYFVCGNGAWRSLAARLAWDQEVGGSNPPAPTILDSPAIELRCGLVIEYDCQWAGVAQW